MLCNSILFCFKRGNVTYLVKFQKLKFVGLVVWWMSDLQVSGSTPSPCRCGFFPKKSKDGYLGQTAEGNPVDVYYL